MARTPSSAIEHYASQIDSDFQYHMRNKERGVAIIINNDEFSDISGLDPRTGSSVDRDRLFRVLKFVGFKDIRIRNNMRMNDMRLLMKKVAAENHTRRDCVFVAVLSHGDENGVYGIDYPIGYEELMAPLKECDTLVGKPKMFLVQACRGHPLDESERGQHDAPAFQKADRVAREADFVLAYSVTPGHYSWRNSQKASWFIQAFHDVMLRDGRLLDFVEILTRVSRMFSYTLHSHAGDIPEEDKQQKPCTISTLTKRLYFL